MSHRARTLDFPEIIDVVMDGYPVTITVRRSNRARRYSLRLETTTGEPLLVIPQRGSLERGLAFAHAHSSWLRERLDGMPGPIPFVPGAEIPLRGRTHVVRRVSKLSGTVEKAGRDRRSGQPQILVPGEKEHFSRRLTDWLKRQARADIEPAVLAYSAKLRVRPKRISIRDQSTRWGSCSASGTLSFSWRLVLAPPFVLDYLAAHEVTHLLEMNHSAKFWRTLERICPETPRAESWLKRHGAGLFRYGQQ